MPDIEANLTYDAALSLKRLRAYAEYNGRAEPVHRFMLSQAPNSTEPHTESA